VFLRDFADQQKRYNLISNHLRDIRACLLQVDYLSSGIRIQQNIFPILKMPWVEGHLLNRYIADHLSDKPALEALERRWLQLLGELKSARIAHGDLQHGNVLVLSKDELQLIDYDGMWVPALDGMGSHEVGHPSYQSRSETETDFHEGNG